MAELPYRRGAVLGNLYGRVLTLFRRSAPASPGSQVPGAPTGVFAVGSSASATVSWTPPANPGSSPLTGYSVIPFRVSTSATLSPVPVSGGSTTSAVVSGLESSNAYTFTVKAINAVGESVASAPSAPVTTIGAPSAPTNLVATAGVSSVSATWTASAGGATSYQVQVKQGVQVVSTTTATGTSKTVTGLTNDTDYTVEVRGVNTAGQSSAAVSGTVQPNWLPVEHSFHGRWTHVQHANNNPLRLVFSRESGGNGGAFGIAYNHIVDPNDNPRRSELTNNNAEDLLIEGDDISFTLPSLWFPADNWASFESSIAEVFRLTTSDGVSRVSLEADGAAIRLKVMGTQVYSRAMQTSTRLTFRLRVKVSASASVGFVQLNLGNTAPGTVLLGQNFRATLPEGATSMQIRAGLNQLTAASARRRVRHNAITADLTRNGVTRRIRLDAEADKVRCHRSTVSGSDSGPSDPDYATLVAAGTTDRIQLLEFQGRLAWKHYVKPGDRHSNGQRAELGLISRRAIGQETNPQKQQLEGDKSVTRWETWIPDAATFPFGTEAQWAVLGQYHQLVETGGSPPQETTIHADMWRFRYNDSSTNLGPYNNVSNPIQRARWFVLELTIKTSDDPAKGYVVLKVDGVTVIPKTFTRTLFLVPGGGVLIPSSSPPEVIGVDVPEQNSFNLGLYERNNLDSGFVVDRTLYHSKASITLYRDPAGPSPV